MSKSTLFSAPGRVSSLTACSPCPATQTTSGKCSSTPLLLVNIIIIIIVHILFSSSQRLPGTTRCGGGPGPSFSWSGQCSFTPLGWPRTGPCRDTRSGPDTPHTQVHGCHEDCVILYIMLQG